MAIFKDEYPIDHYTLEHIRIAELCEAMVIEDVQEACWAAIEYDGKMEAEALNSIMAHSLLGCGARLVNREEMGRHMKKYRELLKENEELKAQLAK